MKKIFISSVQKEFECERAAIKRMIENDPLLKPYFSAFIFELDAPAVDKSTQQVYLNEVEKSDIYLLLVGDKYGYCEASGISPTEQEFNRAEELGLIKLVMVRGKDDSKREEKEVEFLRRVSDGRVRIRYHESDTERMTEELLDEVRNSLRDIMLDDGVLSEKTFEDQCIEDVTIDDIDENRVAWFVERAVRVRKTKYPQNPTVIDVLRSLHLFDVKRNMPTKAGILLFGRDVQGVFPSSAIKCACYPGIEKRKPNIDMELVEGDLFQMADQAIAFVNRHLNHGAGAHNHGAAADDVDEIPNSVIAEAVNNAIAHRNYASIGSIQVEVYSDRVEVISPGRLHRAISVADLYKKHESFATNPRIARAMYQVKYIATLGTGLTDMLAECEAKGLQMPLFEEVSGRFRVVVWRKNLFVDRGDNRGNNLVLGLPEEQRRICEMLIANPRMSVRRIAAALNVRPRTVEKQIAALKVKNVVVREGATRGYWRVIFGAV
jgi:predicted HTH transcriptional regulator